MRVFLKLKWYFIQEKKSYIIGIILLSLIAVLELVPPKIVGMIVDEIQNKTLTSSDLKVYIIILLAIGIFVYSVRYIWRVLIFGSATRLSKMLREQLYQHFTKMSPSFFQKKRIGDLMAHATNDLQAIRETAGVGVLTFVDSLTTGGAVVLAMSFMINWKLTLISLIPMPLMAIAVKRYGTMLHKHFHKAQESFSGLNDKVQESINGVKVIKTFGQEKEDIEAFRKQSNEVVLRNMEVAKVDSLFDPTILLVVGMSFLLTVGFGANFVMNGEMTIGELVTFTGYLGLLIWPMLAFGWFFNIVEKGSASYDRVENILHTKTDITDNPDGIKEVPSGDLRFDIDTFSYSKGGPPVLQDISFRIKSGQTIGISGKTGSGKTTLLRLLLREFEVNDGAIYYGEHLISEYTLHTLRGAFGYVPQDHFLFSTSIAENIAFGAPESNEEDIVNAAKKASVHDDIMEFSYKYETIVGEKGVTLSGGQKQRLSIARALLANPQVLILDDSLSAVDANTEKNLIESIKENREGKTTIVSAHRLSSIEHADFIIVLDQGRILEKGTHEALMAHKGWYYSTYESQKLEEQIKHGG